MKQVIALSGFTGIVILGTFAMNGEGITGSIFVLSQWYRRRIVYASGRHLR